MNDIVTNSIIDNYKFVAENWKRMYEEKKEEVERLNNIINELEEKIISICETCYEDKETARIEKWIKELKGDNNG